VSDVILLIFHEENHADSKVRLFLP